MKKKRNTKSKNNSPKQNISDNEFYSSKLLSDTKNFYSQSLDENISLYFNMIEDFKERELVKDWLKKYSLHKYFELSGKGSLSIYTSEKTLAKGGMNNFKYLKYVIKLYIAIIANDLYRQDIVKSNLTELTENFDYYKRTKNDIEDRKDMLQTVAKVLECIKPEFQLKFIEKHEKLLKDNLSITMLYIELFKDNKVQKAIEIIEQTEKYSKYDKDYVKIADLYLMCLKQAITMNPENYEIFLQNHGVKICQQMQLADYVDSEYYTILVNIIHSFYKNFKESDITDNKLYEFLIKIEDNDNKKFLLFLKDIFENNSDSYNWEKFLEINKNNIHQSLMSTYIFYNVLIKYSQKKVENIKEIEFLGDIVTKDITAIDKMSLCNTFKQFNIAKKFIQLLKIEDFHNKNDYLWYKYTLLSIDKDNMISEIDSCISDNVEKANLYYNLASHYSVGDSKLCLFFLNYIKEIKFSEIELEIVKKYIIPKTAKLSNICKPIEELINNDEVKGVLVSEIKKNHIKKNVIENKVNLSKPKLKENNLERADEIFIINSDQEFEKESYIISSEIEQEPDFTNLSFQEIYNYYECQKIINLSLEERNIHLQSKANKTAAKYQNNILPNNISIKSDSSWKYKGKIYHKPSKSSKNKSEVSDQNTCYELTAQSRKAVYMIIDPNIEDKINDIIAVTQALKKVNLVDVINKIV